MALTRKFLTALGIESEKIDQIIEAHSDTVDGLKDEIKGLKEKAETLETVQKELDDAKKSLETKDAYKVKYDALKEEYDKYKAEVTAKAETDTKTNLYRALLKKAGISEKRLDAVMKVSDIKGLKIGKEGDALEDADKLLEGIKTEWADFITTSETKGAETATPPKGNEAGTHPTSRAAEIYKQHYKALYGEQKGQNA